MLLPSFSLASPHHLVPNARWAEKLHWHVSCFYLLAVSSARWTLGSTRALSSVFSSDSNPLVSCSSGHGLHSPHNAVKTGPQVVRSTDVA